MNEEFGQDFLDENKNMIEKMQNSIKYAILYIKDKRSIDDLNALLSVQNLYINLNNQTNTLVIG